VADKPLNFQELLTLEQASGLTMISGGGGEKV